MIYKPKGKCFKCGSPLEIRNGYTYCTKPFSGKSVSMFDIKGCYYTWNTDGKNFMLNCNQYEESN